MTSAFAYVFTVTVSRPGISASKDRWGDQAETVITHPVAGCVIYPSGSTELTQARSTLLDTAVLLAPYGADIHATDEILVPSDDAVPPPYRDTHWHVSGTPSAWKSPYTGWEPGMEIVLTRQKG